jgi:inosose dehydratase
MDLYTRRTFLATSAAALAATAVPSIAAPLTHGVRYGYAAITWGADERQAIEDIAAVGYPGIQFRANALTDFKPAELRQILAEHKLTFVALSSGDVLLDAPMADEVAKHAEHAQFVKDAGGLYLQVLDKLKPYPRQVTPDECVRLGKLLTEIGKRTADIGIPIGYHNHLNTISEHPDNLDRVLANADPKYVKLELDTAHYLAGGGNPAEAILKYKSRLLFLHLKDVIDIPPTTPGVQYPFQFVELGKGRVDFPAVFKAIAKVGFQGWAVVELDRVPDPQKTPKQCATISRDYLTGKIGVKI